MYAFEFRYTCNVVCADGVQRDLQHTAFFSDHEALAKCLNWWSGRSAPNGGTYEYRETPEDFKANKAARELEIQPGFLPQVIHCGYNNHVTVPTVPNFYLNC